MVMPPRPSSSGMQSIRRELQRRRPKPLAPKSSIAKNPSTPPLPPEGDRCTGWEPRPRSARQEADPAFTASKSPPGFAGTHAPRSHCPRPHPPPRPTAVSRSTPPPSSSALSSSSVGSACRATPGATAHLRPGTAVGVRTRTTTLKTGEALVLWLRAMIVSPTHDGYEVVYDGNWPPGNPYATVDVPRRHVRMIEPSPSPKTTPPSLLPSSAPSSSASDTAAAVAATRKEMRPTPRPTRAGKSLRLIRSLLPEMERQARAALPGY